MSAPNDSYDINVGLSASLAGITSLWRETLGDPKVCIAVLDGPVDRTHPSLASVDLRRIETLVSNVVDAGVATQHGTHIASIIFAQHGGAVAGIAPRCRGLIVPIFQSGKEGSLMPCSEVDLARAILLAAENGASIINVSGGQFAPSGTAHPLLVDAIRHCQRSGVVVIAATGNDGCDCLHVPAALATVLAVGAMNHQGLPLGFSNWGDQYQDSGILAPGENVVGAKLGGGMVAASGTSCATALVAGVTGLLLSLQIKLGQTPDPQAVRAILLRSAVQCVDQPIPDCRRLLAGRLNIEKAMSLVQQGKTIVPDTVVPSTPVSSICQTPTPPSNEASIDVPAVVPAHLTASACSCGSSRPAQLVFALGRLGFDYGTEARRDSIAQYMDPPVPGVPPSPYDPHQLLAYLEKNPWDAASITWTLNLDATAIYAIKAGGPFALETYQRLREFLRDQIAEGVERVSIPGNIVSKTSLMNGQTVPVIEPDLRGMYSWTTQALVESLVGGTSADYTADEEKDAIQKKKVRITDFLERVYFEIRNLGVTPQDRAINFAATNAFNIGKVYEAAIKEDLDLDSIEVERSPICRPESDCWDVKLVFFFPQRQVQTVCKVFRLTVDVSDVVPVTVGPVRSWFVR